MKKGKHPNNALTAVKVRKLTKPGSYADGNGLYLKVDESGARRWIQRLTINGKRRELGLGSARLVTLAEAREEALNNRKVARAGGDPLAEKRKTKGIMTFEEAARKVHEIYLPTWSNEKQGQQWINTLSTYAFPYFGNKRMDIIDNADIHNALLAIWTVKHETAKRVKQRISTVIEWGIAQGWRNDNPTQSIARGLPKVQKTKQHHRSLPFQEVSAAISKIQDSNASISAKLALEILILTAHRSGEVRNAKWDEIDFDNKVWVVPKERMKKRKEHKVPLSPRCLEILEEAEKLKIDDKDIAESDKLIFPSLNTGRALSDVTLSKLLKEHEIDCVPHGFRTSFRMWAGEETHIPREVCEFALAHVVGDEAERAYQRSDLFDKRRILMNMWDDYLNKSTGKIISISQN